MRRASSLATARGNARVADSLVFCLLVMACIALLLTAPAEGNFWWNDAPRHAMNGVFVRDFVTAHPFDRPMQWAIDYYLKRPALTIMFYPPLFYAVEAAAFALFGVSHFVAQATVAMFTVLLAGSSYGLARIMLPRWSAAGAALLVIGTPEVAFWARQVMLDIPAYAFIVASAWALSQYIRLGRPWSIYASAVLLLAAIYTKYNAGFIAPALCLAFVLAKGKAALHDKHAVIAGMLAVAGLAPAVLFLMKFGASNLESVSGLQGTLPLNSLACWLFYITALPSQLGLLLVILGVAGMALVGWRCVVGDDRWFYALLLGWLIFGYLFFTLISLKESRDTIMVLLPLAFGAVLLLHSILPAPLGQASGLTLGVGSLLYTLLLVPVSKVDGYRDIASYLAGTVPLDGIVVYAGYRDGNLIFDLTEIPARKDIAVERIDKLLLSVPVGERRRGVRQANYDEATIKQMLRDSGASYFVIQPGFWSDLGVMSRFYAVMNGPDYQKVAHFDIAGTLSTQDGTGGIDIFKPAYPVSVRRKALELDMPLAGQHFQGSLSQ